MTVIINWEKSCMKAYKEEQLQPKFSEGLSYLDSKDHLLKMKCKPPTYDKNHNHKRQVRRTNFFRWLTAFISLVLVPTCQSMPSQNPPSNTIVINQIGQQNIQTVNVSYNIQTQNK